MTDINFEADQLSIRLKLLSVDKNDIESMRCGVELDIVHPTGKIFYSADDIWLETKMLDEFSYKLSESVNDRAEFYDMSNYLVISIRRRRTFHEVNIGIREPLCGGGEATIETRLHIALDGRFLIKLLHEIDKFRSFL